MKVRVFISVLIISLAFWPLAFAAADDSSWSCQLKLTGENLGGVSEAAISVGICSEDKLFPAPPAPPEYSAQISLMDMESGESYFKDLRKSGERVYKWVIAVDPHGNIGSPFTTRNAILTWNPSCLASGTYQLFKGTESQATLLVPDMKALESFEIWGSSEIQYLTLQYTP